MSLESRFTDEEQQLLTSTPSLIGSSMAFAEGSGLGTIKELFANAKTYIGGAKQFPNNEIIVGVLPNLEDRKDAMAKAKEMREKMMNRLKQNEIDSHEKLKTQLLNDCKAINTLLSEKSSLEEAEDYKEWAMSVAENVAKAAKEGGFLGIGGERISVGEKELFAEVAEALGTNSKLT
jgi:hypothetical protein